MQDEGRDRENITLPGNQEALVQAVVATGTPVVVVLIHGGPLAIEWTRDHVSAIVSAHYPGELGGEVRQAVHLLEFSRPPPTMSALAGDRRCPLRRRLSIRAHDADVVPCWLHCAAHDGHGPVLGRGECIFASDFGGVSFVSHHIVIAGSHLHVLQGSVAAMAVWLG